MTSQAAGQKPRTDAMNHLSADRLSTDLCVIGAGAAGLSVASSAALLGVPVVLVERGAMGGDCLNAGCVPSKALIAAAKAAQAGRNAAGFGVRFRAPVIDRAAVTGHVRQVIEAIRPMDSPERYRALGVNVIAGEARFVDGRTVEVNGTAITARRFIIATGAAPAIPAIPGLADVPFLTNESIFALEETPKRLAILGGGPIGIELAQAHRRLGSDVTIIERDRILSREDPEAANLLRRLLEQEGIRLLEGARVERVGAVSSGVTLDLSGAGVPKLLNCSHLLVAAGRTPRLDGLGLAAAGVASDARGIIVDKGLKTANRRIYAIGDCIGGPQFTHVAGYQAGLVVKNALFRLPVRVDYHLTPRVTYCDPEIAVIGLSEDQARAAHKGVQTLRWPLSENDRARAERTPEGFVKAMVDGKGRILGVTIVGPHAGDLVAPWVLAMRQGLKIGAMVDLVLPYPTLSEASRRAAVQSLVPKLRSPWVGRMLRFLRKLG